MSNFSLYVTQEVYTRQDAETYARRVATRLYRKVCRQARLAQFWNILRGHSNKIATLEKVEFTNERHYSGAQVVPLDQIEGSEGRTQDFDAALRPLNPHNAARWQSIAQAHFLEQALPAVELIRVGQRYFIRDGHHRVSVARALGQASLDAIVTVWQ